MWTDSGTVIRLCSTTSTCPSSLILTMLVCEDLKSSSPPDPQGLMTSISSLVTARVRAFFFDFVVVVVRAANRIGGIRFSFSPPHHLLARSRLNELLSPMRPPLCWLLTSPLFGLRLGFLSFLSAVSALFWLV